MSYKTLEEAYEVGKKVLGASDSSQDYSICIDHLWKIQEAKNTNNISWDWKIKDRNSLIPHGIEKTKEQEKKIIAISKEYIAKELKIKSDEMEHIHWDFVNFRINNIKNIDNTNQNFFKILNDYRICFENCHFVGYLERIDEQEGRMKACRIEKITIEFANFDRCTFHNSLILDNVIFSHECFFISCTFKKIVRMKKCTFRGRTEFQSSTFEKEIDFSESNFQQDTFFSGKETIFEKKANFKNTTFSSLTMFSGATFRDDVDFSLTRPIDINKGFRDIVSFKLTHFEKKANFKSSLFCQKADFQGSIFKSQAFFSQAKFEENVDFAKIKLEKEGELNFSKAQIGKKDKDREQQYSLNFNNAILEGEVDFSSTFFYSDTYFHRAIFHRNIQFYRSYFEGIANFYFVDFRGIPNFSMCVFNQPKFANFVGVVLPQNTIDKLGDYISQKAGDEANQKDNIEKR